MPSSILATRRISSVVAGSTLPLITRTFEDSLIDKKLLEKNYYEINNYEAYLGTIIPVTRIKNNKLKSTNKLLIIKDSYVHVIALIFLA